MALFKRIAILDLGTNTFLLLISEVDANGPRTIHQERAYVSLGEGSLEQGVLTPEAQERAFETLRSFKKHIDDYQVAQVQAVATSTLRSVSNGEAFVQQVKQEIGIDIKIIDGEEEAALVYEGVKKGVSLGEDPVLMMDIGGGSIELIIGNAQAVQWQQSLEMGAQRLWDKFHHSDAAITPAQLAQLEAYLDTQLQPLWETVRQYSPTILVGSSGTFQSLISMHRQRIGKSESHPYATAHDIPVASFNAMYKDIRYKSKEERLQTPGLSANRSDLIVVACAFVDKILQKTGIDSMIYSTYSLRMGLLQRALEEDKQAE